jgi:hypothetical protein
MNPILLAAAWLLRVDFDFVTANPQKAGTLENPHVVF